jgi:hypothetical protein
MNLSQEGGSQAGHEYESFGEDYEEEADGDQSYIDEINEDEEERQLERQAEEARGRRGY